MYQEQLIYMTYPRPHRMIGVTNGLDFIGVIILRDPTAFADSPTSSAASATYAAHAQTTLAKSRCRFSCGKTMQNDGKLHFDHCGSSCVNIRGALYWTISEASNCEENIIKRLSGFGCNFERMLFFCQAMEEAFNMWLPE